MSDREAGLPSPRTRRRLKRLEILLAAAWLHGAVLALVNYMGLLPNWPDASYLLAVWPAWVIDSRPLMILLDSVWYELNIAICAIGVIAAAVAAGARRQIASDRDASALTRLSALASLISPVGILIALGLLQALGRDERAALRAGWGNPLRWTHESKLAQERA